VDLSPKNVVETDAGLIFYFTFYLFGGLRTHPTHPPAYGPEMIAIVEQYDTIRYDTICYFSVLSKTDTSQLNLPHGIFKTKKWKDEKVKSKNG